MLSAPSPLRRLVLSLLCVALLANLQGTEGFKHQVDQALGAITDVAADAPTREQLVCTPEFKLHSANVKFCVKATWNDKTSCGAEIDINLQINQETSWLFTKKLDPQHMQLCTPPMTAPGIASDECGTAATYCVEFGQPGSNLTLGPGFAYGCPKMVVRNCVPKDGSALPEISANFDCFSLGYHCFMHTDCDTCMKSGCGWCGAGYRQEYSCMLKAANGSLCPSACESTCDCHWHDKVCPVDKEYLQQMDSKMNKLDSEITKLNNRTDSINRDIQSETPLQIADKKYECLDMKTIHHDHSTQTAVTVTVVLLCTVVGLCVGVFLGKLGYLDLLLGNGYFHGRAAVQPLCLRDNFGPHRLSHLILSDCC